MAYGDKRLRPGRRGKRVAAIPRADDLQLLAVDDAADLGVIAEALADPENESAAVSWEQIEKELVRLI